MTHCQSVFLKPTMRFSWITFLFWLGLPALIYMLAGGVGAWLLDVRWIPTRRKEGVMLNAGIAR